MPKRFGRWASDVFGQQGCFSGKSAVAKLLAESIGRDAIGGIDVKAVEYGTIIQLDCITGATPVLHRLYEDRQGTAHAHGGDRSD